VPSGLGFIFDLRMVGKLEVGADDGRVRFTMPRALAELAAANGAWPVEGPRVLPDGRADLWLTPTRGKLAVVGNERFGMGLRAAWPPRLCPRGCFAGGGRFVDRWHG
jgi:hypothetical protein